MIICTHGDIFESGAEALVSPVNCVGVMGAGLARQFRKRYPSNFTLYAYQCEHNWLHIGEVYGTEGEPGDLPRFIFNFPTKRHWVDRSSL